MLRRSLIAVLAAAAAAPAMAHGPGHAMSGGKPGNAAKATRTIEVVATDNAFSLKSLDVKDGETVRFVVRNDGLDPHEFLIGTKSEHAEHLKMMRAMIEEQKKRAATGAHASHAAPIMEHPSGVMVAAGQTASFVWTFARTANLEFACDIPGHYEDGMHGPITFGR
jgi:uncharacterized cupredoxin-like copper-binding protein